jgi:hypothetical protein
MGGSESSLTKVEMVPLLIGVVGDSGQIWLVRIFGDTGPGEMGPGE